MPSAGPRLRFPPPALVSCTCHASSDGFAVRSRDLATGAETTLVRSQTDLRARISPDGGAVAYNPSLFEPNETVIYLVASSWRRLPLSFAILAG